MPRREERDRSRPRRRRDRSQSAEREEETRMPECMTCKTGPARGGKIQIHHLCLRPLCHPIRTDELHASATSSTSLSSFPTFELHSTVARRCVPQSQLHVILVHTSRVPLRQQLLQLQNLVRVGFLSIRLSIGTNLLPNGVACWVRCVRKWTGLPQQQAEDYGHGHP